MSNDQVIRLKEWRETHPAPNRNWREKLRAEQAVKRQAFVAEFKAAMQPPPGPMKWQRQCRELDSETGKRCTLLEHGFERPHSASGRVFRNPLAVGAQPRRAIDDYAVQQSETLLDTGSANQGERDRDSVRAAQKRYAAKRKATAAAGAP